jgi:hypothetical protein
MNEDYLSICISIYLWLYNPCGPWPRFQFLNIYTTGRTPWMGNQPYTQNKRTQTSMPRVVFEPTIPAFERVKTVHALYRAATVIGILSL